MQQTSQMGQRDSHLTPKVLLSFIFQVSQKFIIKKIYTDRGTRTPMNKSPDPKSDMSTNFIISALNDSQDIWALTRETLCHKHTGYSQTNHKGGFAQRSHSKQSFYGFARLCMLFSCTAKLRYFIIAYVFGFAEILYNKQSFIV